MSEKEKFMREALNLAKNGQGKVSPNPLVGAVVVKDGKILSQGYHKEYGGPHAEIFALDEAGVDAGGADLYVTLEPCVHQGKTPPCTNRILGSTSKCNCQGCLRRKEYFVRGSEAKRLPWSMIEAVCHMLDFLLNNVCQFPSFGEVLANQSIRVLV